jgi:hypothetical protein
MADIVSVIVVGGVFIFFGAVMYKALKEPIDLIGGLLKEGFKWIGEQLGMIGTETVEVVTYE